ncbi:DUF4185 domain-containing protein [Streptomyces sp. SL13]|uniref:DUF4185 domain-containing protein n=1 Tax=Streptantibioticus silvisoli TaxID=2705255 RepID=A0AA90HAC8_9ACTN|nr:DUF4185 domain-containing protein [Streptantibioticus silvisoli]MDI5973763.1 DUF4185 domain-containing protein [Streptantibioticus silvisoli]
MGMVHRRGFLGLAMGAVIVPALRPISAAASAPGPAPAVAPAATGGFVYPAPGQSTGPGVLPAKPASVEYLGAQDYGTDVARDLGFSGVVNGQSVWTYGDTLVPNGSGGYALSASDSVGLGDSSNPLRVYDTVNSSGWPSEWIPLNAAENANGGLSRYGMGGTNVVEYAPGKGLVWYLKNDRGTDGQGIVGAGVATVTAGPGGAVATRTSDTTWGPTEPHWGDVGVTYNPLDGKVYVYGHGPDPYGLNVYLARASAAQATDVSAYEYWNQSAQAWTNLRFSLSGALGTVKLSDDLALFSHQELGQSNAFWSNHFNTWMFVAGANVGYTDIMVMTAPALEGPWTAPVTVASTCPGNVCSAIRYAIAPHPEYDPTGETILVTWTDSNVVHTARIHWQ